MNSTFYPPRSGTPSAWIVYKGYGNGAVNFIWTGAADASPMIKVGNGSFPSGPSYIVFQGLNLNGNGNAADGFLCRGGHHVSFVSNSISNTGGSGIGSINCDYLVADHNLMNHNGYIPSSTSTPQWYSWTSAISYNSAQWFDNYAGFHNIVSNNIITGEYDGSSHHTDGNGIILDLSNGSYNYSSANTPPALIINNVVYGNGGGCIDAYVVTNFWIVNNTCYKNGLDTSGPFGSLVANKARDGYFINNIVVAWRNDTPSYGQENVNANIRYYANLYFGSSKNFSYTDPSQFIDADPLFSTPPVFDPVSRNQYATAIPPSRLENGLTLRPASPALRKGIDPSTLPGLPAAVVKDLAKYIYVDINGKPRPRQGRFDLGAYQVSSSG